jgi:hypothetical protein
LPVIFGMNIKARRPPRAMADIEAMATTNQYSKERTDIRVDLKDCSERINAVKISVLVKDDVMAKRLACSVMIDLLLF